AFSYKMIKTSFRYP
ncbi:hypothetical protein CP8484711_2272B, partial [Chlamydia psittaci 84-8471/1]